MITEEKRNILTGILGTVAIHLVILIAFLVIKIGEVRVKQKEVIAIEFSDEDYKTLEQIMEEKKVEPTPLPQLNQQDLSNIASNVADKMNEEISTDKYIEEVMKDLGVDELNPHYDNSLPEDPVYEDKKEPKKEETSRNYGQTRITYNVPGRKGRHIDRPIYRCQGGGTIVINIVVDQSGSVVQASVANSNTSEECVPATALTSARKTTFNSDYSGPKRVEGTITYIFVAQ